MALKIPEDEIDLCRELMKPAWVAVGLANDIFSWPKERDAGKRFVGVWEGFRKDLKSEDTSFLKERSDLSKCLESLIDLS